jgi:hypothetical protein
MAKEAVMSAGIHIRLSCLPDALRVNANLFQTDLCRHPEHMDVLVSFAIHGIWNPAIPAGMTLLSLSWRL